MSDGGPNHLRAEFGEWMRTALGYPSVASRVLVGGASKDRSHVVDLRGERWSKPTEWLRLAGFLLLAAALLLKNARPDTAPATMNLLFVAGVAVLVVAHVARRRTRRYTWVTCRNQDKPLLVADVQRLADRVDRVRGQGPVGWTPAEVILVAGPAGFDPEALQVAKARAVQCYRRSGSGFERVTHA